MLLLGDGNLGSPKSYHAVGKDAGLGACEGTIDDTTGSATFTFKGTVAPASEESIRVQSDGFTSDTVADFFLAFGF